MIGPGTRAGRRLRDERSPEEYDADVAADDAALLGELAEMRPLSVAETERAAREAGAALDHLRAQLAKFKGGV